MEFDDMTENGVLTEAKLRTVLSEYTGKIGENINEAIAENRKELISLKAHVDVEFKKMRDEIEDFRTKVRDNISDALRRHDTEVDLKLERFRNEVQKELNTKLSHIDAQLDPIAQNVSSLVVTMDHMTEQGKKRDADISLMKAEAKVRDQKLADLRVYVDSNDERFRQVVNGLYGDEVNKTPGLIATIERMLITIDAMSKTLVDVHTFVINRRSIEQFAIRFLGGVPWKRAVLILVAGSGGATIITALRVIFGL